MLAFHLTCKYHQDTTVCQNSVHACMEYPLYRTLHVANTMFNITADSSSKKHHAWEACMVGAFHPHMSCVNKIKLQNSCDLGDSWEIQ